MVFETTAGEAHYHVPLLLGPFGFTTYRGTCQMASLMPSFASLKRDLHVDCAAAEHEARARRIPAMRRPATRSHVHWQRRRVYGATPARELGAQALDGARCIRAHAAGVRQGARPPQRSGLAETVRVARRRQAQARTGRRFPARFRRRLRHAAGRRRRRPRAIGGRGSGGRHEGRDAAAVHRHPHQADVARAARAQPAHARSVRDHAGRNRRKRLPDNFAVTVPKVMTPAMSTPWRARARRWSGG